MENKKSKKSKCRCRLLTDVKWISIFGLLPIIKGFNEWCYLESPGISGAFTFEAFNL